jgi:hypothetical protein
MRPITRAARLRALIAVLPGTTLLLLADALTRCGATWLARGSCNVGVGLFPEYASLFRTQLAAVRSAGGDLDGGIVLLETAMPEPESAVFRDLHAGWFCEDHGEWARAADHFQRVLVPGTPNAPSAESQAWLRNHILELRRRTSADGSGVQDHAG